MQLMDRALALPPFLAGCFMLYWSLPLSVLMNKVKFLKLYGKRDDAFGWGVGLQTLFGVRVLQLPGPRLCKSGTIIYLSNHRCWADFFLDVVLTDGNAQMLSRMAVLFVFPMFMVAVWLIRSVVLFKRGSKFEKEKFNAWVNSQLTASPVGGLIVYPEGHRSTQRDSLPLKRGMLHFAFASRHPVQILMTANKEAVLSEKDMVARFGQTVLVGYSEIIRPADFASFEAFMAAVQAEWDRQWHRVYSADWSTAVEKPPGEMDNRDYPHWMKFWQIVFTGTSCLCFFVTIYWLVRGAAWALAACGPFRAWVSALLLVYTAASFARAFQPVRLPAPA